MQICISTLCTIYHDKKTQLIMLAQGKLSGRHSKLKVNEEFISFEDFGRYILNDLRYPTKQSNKFETYGWVPALYEPEFISTEEDGSCGFIVNRRAGHLESDVLTLFIADVDNDKHDILPDGSSGDALPIIDIETVIERLDVLDLQYVIYTSFSHTDQQPKFRVIIPVSRPISRAEMYRLYGWLNWNVFGQQADGSIYNPGDFLYAPPHNSRTRESYRGGALDVDSYHDLALQLVAGADGMKVLGFMLAHDQQKRNRTSRKPTVEEAARLQGLKATLDRTPGVSINNPRTMHPDLKFHFHDEVGHSRWEIMRSLLGHVWVRGGGLLTRGDMLHIWEELVSTHPRVQAHALQTGKTDVWLGWPKGAEGRDSLIDFIMDQVVEGYVSKAEWKSILDSESTGLTFDYIEGECGQGKTATMNAEIVRKPGLWVFAVMKISDMADRKKELLRLFPNSLLPAGWDIKAVHSKNDEDDNTVRTQLNILRASIDTGREADNMVVYVTHAGLMQNDWSAWGDFKLIIDEVPEVFSSWTKNYQNHTNELTRYLRPRGEDGDCVELVLTDAGREKLKNGKFDDVDVLVRGVLERANLDNAQLWAVKETWDNMHETSVRFVSMFNPDFVSRFQQVIILGDEFTKSILHKAWTQKWGVNWRPYPGWRPQRRIVPLNKRVRLHYFSDCDTQRDASITLFRDNPNSPLAQVGRWVEANEKKELLYAVNVGLRGEVELKSGDLTSPKMHGNNNYRHYLACLWLVALRPGKDESSLIKSVLGLTADEVREWRERNAMYQYIMRTALRQYDAGSVVDVYVFDKGQADYLRRRWNLSDQQITHHAGVVQGINGKRQGRPPNDATKGAQSGAEKQRAYRQRQKGQAANSPAAGQMNLEAQRKLLERVLNSARGE